MSVKERKSAPSILYLAVKIFGLLSLCFALLWILDYSKILGVSQTTYSIDNNGEIRETKNASKTLPRDNVVTLRENELKEEQQKEQFKKNLKNEKTVYLTFDDGPTPSTEKAIEILDRHQIQATFFMLEPNMRKYEDTVEKLHTKGHTLGLHGVSHDQKKFYASTTSVINEMNVANQTLEKITGIRSSLVRTPFGSKPNLSDSQAQALTYSGFTYWDWNVDSFDWRYRNSQYVDEVLEQVKTTEKDFPEQPIVILMHDRAETVQSLNLLITLLKDQGYKFGKIQDGMEPVHLH
ncbi:polysaccharide deacetylase family protein [Metabacillus arenae]|uniref:Polysaccharide deacetylase n=1 Tax=Metabacillus arenae TaxID=2771434 RepID=A0A926S3X5_9BACI|nr:polysaccharide deacetylase family protein [Metabacillus arenae]MBD1383404.1 polysaccharide deacetylase [Metabacillus arenae]